MRDEVKKVLAVPYEKVDVIPNGIFTNHFVPDGDLREFRRGWASDDEKIVFFVGRDVYEKGAHVLVEAFGQVLKSYEKVKLVIAGKGERKDQKDIAQRLGIQDKVYFAGFIDDETLYKLYKVVDTAVFPSIYESRTTDQSGFSEPDIFEFDEATFNRLLALERRRTDRSKSPFMLMLLSLEQVPAGENGKNPHKKIMAAISSSIRDMDAVGWYRAGSILGIIFTEICDYPKGSNCNCIVDRVKTKLEMFLDAPTAEKIELSVYFYPASTELIEHKRARTANSNVLQLVR
jgi:hypothetical protein